MLIWLQHSYRAAKWYRMACMAAQVAEQCLQKAGDLSGLLLLYTAKGSGNGLADLIKKRRGAEQAERRVSVPPAAGAT